MQEMDIAVLLFLCHTVNMSVCVTGVNTRLVLGFIVTIATCRGPQTKFLQWWLLLHRAGLVSFTPWVLKRFLSVPIPSVALSTPCIPVPSPGVTDHCFAPVQHPGPRGYSLPLPGIGIFCFYPPHPTIADLCLDPEIVEFPTFLSVA